MEFQAWPKTARLFRDVVITEKIDGTNAAIIITQETYLDHERAGTHFQTLATVPSWWELTDDPDGAPLFEYNVWAQSRTRLITPENDNHGFARWVRDNAETLVRDLGPGRHFGEWWGPGIQRKYGLDHKRFSLFNTAKWGQAKFETPNMDSVPVLYNGVFSESAVSTVSEHLKTFGSAASPGFMNPEGVCVFHTQSRKVYKYTLDGDGHKEKK
jgi:hypothetical protein